MIHRVKVFSIVNEADLFLKFSCFLYDPIDTSNLISGSSAFSKSNLWIWNFAGRQNDIHSPIPGDIFKGNWECGIGFIDRIRLGDQSGAPACLADNKSKNHYYMLPLILGLIGMFFQYSRDKRGCWLTFLMFFITGIPVATAEFSKFAGILSAALSQHHLSGCEIAELECHHLH